MFSVVDSQLDGFGSHQFGVGKDVVNQVDCIAVWLMTYDVRRREEKGAMTWTAGVN